MADNAPTSKTLEEIAQAYDSPPLWYDIRGLFILTFAYRSTIGFQLKFFGNNMGPRHLEAAIGSGSLTDVILKWRKWKGLPAVHITGFDYAMPMLAGAIKRFRNRPDVELHLADVAALPFESERFDTASVANAIHCFPDINGALKDLHRVLKPGGKLIANVLLYPTAGPSFLLNLANRINDWGMNKGILTTPYHQADIRQRIVNAGFQIESELLSGNTYNVVAKKPA